MGRFMDVLLSVVRVLCSTPLVEPTEWQQPEVPPQRPQVPPPHRLEPQSKPVSYYRPEVLTERPPQYPPRQEWKPVSKPLPPVLPQYPPKQHLKPVSHPKLVTELPQTPPQYRPLEPVSYPKPVAELPQSLPQYPPSRPVSYPKPVAEPPQSLQQYPPLKPVSYPKPVAELPQILPQYPPKQDSKPVSRPKPVTEPPQTLPQHRPKRERKSVSHPKPEVLTERLQIPPQQPPEQELKPVSYPPLAHPQARPPPERDLPSKDRNQINQHDEHYVALRAKAVEHGDLMARSFQEGHEAYSRGDRALAKELSEKGKLHKRTMESLNAEASAWIFRQNNLDSKPGEIDLHGLYVKEALSYVDKAIQEARGRGDSEIRLIVGKGLHANDGVAKIKPAVDELLKNNNIPSEVDPRNGGVLIARLR